MKKILRGLTAAENFIMIVTFSIMVLCAFAQVVNRNIFKLPISWFDEAATYCMIYMALIGTEMGLRDGTQIAVTAVVDKLHGNARRLVNIISKAIVIIFSATVFITSVRMVGMQLKTGQTSAALHLPMAVPYAALVISFAMIVLVQSGEVIGLMIQMARGEKEEEVNAK